MLLNLEDELYNLVKVSRDPRSGLYSLEYPSRRTVQQVWLTLGVRAAPPEADDPIWRVIEQRVKANMPRLRQIANQLCTGTVPGNQETAIMTQKTAPNPNAQQGDAAVRSMTGAQAIAECKRLGLTVKPHETNPGITAMRAKNILYVAAREGASIKTPVADQRKAA